MTSAFEVFTSSGDGLSFANWPTIAIRYLLTLPADQAISCLLRDIGERADVDRAWMFEYDRTLLRFRNTHEWCRGGIATHVEDLQDAPVTLIAWLHRSLMKGEAVAIHDVTKLPRTARSLQVEMLRQDDKSVLSVPIFHEGQLWACIGFDTTRQFRVWKSDEASALAECADLIALARYGSSVREEVANRRADAPLLYLRQRGGIRGVALHDILGIRSARDYTNVWLTDGSVILDTRALSVWLAMLPVASFLRVHRSAVVNLLHVCDVARARDAGAQWSVTLRGAVRPWSVSRPYRQELRARIGI